MPAPLCSQVPASPAVLLVEDHEACRNLIAEVLTLAGFEVCTAPDGRRVPRILRRRAIDLVITDVMMPGRDGISTMTFLHDHHPHVPVIAISGNVALNRDLYRMITEKLGAAHFFAKPFKMDQLITAARKAIAANTASDAVAG